MAKSRHDILPIRESGPEADDTPSPPNIRQRHRDGQLLTRRIREIQAAGLAHVRPRLVRLAQIRLEGYRLVPRLDECHGPAVCHNRREDGKVDVAQRKRARTRHDEALQCRICKGARDGREEGRLGRDALQEQAEGAVLLSLLANDRGHEADNVRGVVIGEEHVGILKGSKDYGGECLGQEDCVVEVGRGECVLAR